MSTAATSSLSRNLGAEIAAFGSWWMHELGEVATLLRQRLQPEQARRFRLELSDKTAVLRPIGVASSLEPVSFDLEEGLHLPSLQRLWSQGTPASAQVSVALGEPQVLLCSLQLPPVSNFDLQGTIDLQLERELPLPRAQLNIDWVAEPRRGTLPRKVTVAVAKRSDIERLRSDIESWGWQLAAVGLARDAETLSFNLLPRRVRRVSLAMGRPEWRLLWCAVALTCAYGFIVTGQWWYERSSLSSQLSNARTQVARMEQQRAAIAARKQPLLALRDIMQSPSAAEALAALSAAVPQDSWVYQAEIRAPAPESPSIKLEGYAPAATALVDALEKSAQLEHVQLVRASSAGVAAGTDRVELTARLERRKP